MASPGTRARSRVFGQFYLRGFEADPTKQSPDVILSWAYTAVNAAFALDTLADLIEKRAHLTAQNIKVQVGGRRAQAKEIRAQIVETLTGEAFNTAGVKTGAEENTDSDSSLTWWYFATVAEAYFGLENFSETYQWLTQGLTGKNPPASWQLESTTRQLADVTRLQLDDGLSIEQLHQTKQWQILEEFLGPRNKAGLYTAFFGKLSLALSGGGFRASLFHLGVLARLAEIDLLRHVEVLSGVSGGSIVGAQYYLELRALLMSKTDDVITRDDYIRLVEQTIKHFYAGVTKNLRMRLFSEWTTGVRLLFDWTFTRTHRLGELYEKHLFENIGTQAQAGQPDQDFEPLCAPIYMSALRIFPKGETGFFPRLHNWRRFSKVPTLILNATSLNTGHNWQFTASFMGEPRQPINKNIDAAPRLRRMYYDEAPDNYKNVRLGHAVAASSCVPGLLEPLVLDGLYKGPDGEKLSLQLIDGGVYDNQGTAGLLEQNCNVLVVSDASGQLPTEYRPGSAPVSVYLRTTDVLMSRVRGSEYQELTTLKRVSALKGLAFLHLKMGLNSKDIGWQESTKFYPQHRQAHRRQTGEV